MRRPTYANVMATLAVVLALAAGGGGQTLADAASSAATGVKRALAILTRSPAENCVANVRAAL